MRLERLDSSCGVGEFASFQDTRSGAESVAYIAQHALNKSESVCDCECENCKECSVVPEALFALILWSDVATASPGAQLATHITGKRTWGRVTASELAMNPNTDTNIKVWTWKPTKAFYKWAAKQ